MWTVYKEINLHIVLLHEQNNADGEGLLESFLPLWWCSSKWPIQSLITLLSVWAAHSQGQLVVLYCTNCKRYNVVCLSLWSSRSIFTLWHWYFYLGKKNQSTSSITVVQSDLSQIKFPPQMNWTRICLWLDQDHFLQRVSLL